MTDKFVFSNFAATTLRAGVGASETEFLLNSDDVELFPELADGAMFPLVLTDSQDHNEIVYVTALSDVGVATVQREREGTLARGWLAGTLCRHTFTAASVRQAAGFNPRGAWNAATTYDPNDVVLADGISYIARRVNLNALPSVATDDWQAVYTGSAEGGTTLNWRGRWSADGTYLVGQVVEWQGRIWQRLGAGSGLAAPAFGDESWTHIARWSGYGIYEPILTMAGVNNYTVDLAGADGPEGLFDGMTLRGRPVTTNTGSCTLTVRIDGVELLPVPLRWRAATELPVGAVVAGEVYDWVYVAATNEFLPVVGPYIDRSEKVPTGTMLPFAGPIAPSGYLLCNGQTASRTVFAALFAVIGTVGGPGDGVSTFNLPDLSGRTFVGVDTMLGISAGVLPAATIVGWVGGTTAEDVLINQDNLPEHIHYLSGNTDGVSTDHTHDAPTYTGNAVVVQSGTGASVLGSITQGSAPTSGASVNHVHAIDGVTDGVVSPANNPVSVSTVQPSFAVNVIIKT